MLHCMYLGIVLELCGVILNTYVYFLNSKGRKTVVNILCKIAFWWIELISSLLSPSSPAFNLSQLQGFFLMSQDFTSGGQSIGASASVLPMNIQGWFLLGWTGWISLQSKGLSRVFSNTTVQKYKFFGAQPSLWANSHPYMTPGKTIALTRQTFVGKISVFNMLSRFVLSFKEQKSFNFMALVIVHSDFGDQESKVCYCFYCLPIYLPWSEGTRCHDLPFLNAEV